MSRQPPNHSPLMRERAIRHGVARPADCCPSRDRSNSFRPKQSITTLPHPPAPTPGPNAQYGEYLSYVSGCRACHGDHLSGGHIPGTPSSFKNASNLTPTGIGHYSEADFTRAPREGVRPGGIPIDTLMPVRDFKSMNDDEIHALYAYLRTVPPREYGNR